MKCPLFSALALSLVVGFAVPAHSATIELLCPKDPNGQRQHCDILLTGPISSGDTKKLLEVVANPPTGQTYFRNLVLDSLGGDAVEALRIADAAKRSMLDTMNGHYGNLRGYPCVSACVLVLVGGGSRTMWPLNGGKVGLHRPYFSQDAYIKSNPNMISQNQSQVMQRLREFLQSEGMATDLIEKMMRHSSREIYWVEYQEWSQKVSTYAPWYEETLIARCNYNPRFMEGLRKGLATGDKKAVELYHTESRRVEECTTVLRERAQQEIRRSLATDKAHAPRSKEAGELR